MLTRPRLETRQRGSYFASPHTDVEFINSGSKLLDLALGGGWAQDRVINIIGNSSTGKTLLCIEACANFALTYAKGLIKYREPENAFLEDYAMALGLPRGRVEFDDVDPIQTVENLFDDLSATMKAARGKRVLYILDSLDALSDQGELDRDFGEGSFGTQKAKDMSKMFRMLIGDMARNHLTFIVVSQVRDKIGFGFGKKIERSGGRALEFYAAQIVMLTQLGRVYKTVSGMKRVIGVDILAQVDKNKVGLPFRSAKFPINFGYGLQDDRSCLDWLQEARELSKEQAETWQKRLNKMNSADHREAMKGLRQRVEAKWWTVEKSFLPTRSKYGA